MESQVFENQNLCSIIAKYVVISRKPNFSKRLNQIAILFKNYPKFVKACYSQFNPKPSCSPGKSHFWQDLMKKFKESDNFVIDGNQKGSTRKKMYLLAIKNGYRYTTTSQKRVESRVVKGRCRYYEYKRDFTRTYTLGQLKIKGIDYKNVWEPDGGTGAYKVKGDACLYKRGRMINTSGRMNFTKI